MKPFQIYASALLISAAMLISGCSSSSKKEEAPAPQAAAPEATSQAAPEATPQAAPEAAPEAASAAPSGSSATVGEKLIDLNKAREAGAITDEEYETAKKKLLDSQ